MADSRGRPRLTSPDVQDDELAGGNGRVGQEVRARVDRGGVDPEVSGQGGSGDVEARSPGPGLRAVLLRETDGDEGAVALEGDDGRSAGPDDRLKRDHRGLTEARGDLADARSAPCELGGCLEWERDELRFLRRACVHADLAVGQVGELGGIRSSSFFSSAAAVTVTAAPMSGWSRRCARPSRPRPGNDPRGSFPPSNDETPANSDMEAAGIEPASAAAPSERLRA